MTDLTVACVYVRGHVPFSVDYVAKLYAMVKRYAGCSFRFVCLTDRPDEMPPGVEPILIHAPIGLKGWWAKLELFNKRHGFKGRMLYFDLDVLIIKELSKIINYPSEFALVPDGAPNFKPRDGLQVIKRFNSSVMVWNAGINYRLYDAWTPSQAQRLWGDQDWIGERYPQASVMPIWWFPRLSEVNPPPLPFHARVILAKKPKNHLAAAALPWFNEMWG